MREDTHTWTADDGATLFARVWRPAAGSPRAHLALVHGYAEHSGRYGRLAAELCARGFAVHAFDWRGHGRSPGVPGHIESHAQLVRDVRAFVGTVPQPAFLFGHSAGGSAALLAAEETADLEGLVLSSPYLVNAVPMSDGLMWLARRVATIFPLLPIKPLDFEALSRDPAEVSAYRTDPLVYTGRIRARTGVELLELGAAALDSAPAMRAPVLLVHGGADRIADPEGSRRLLAASGSSDKALEMLRGGFHELLNDLEGARVTHAIVDWLERRA